VAYTVAILPAAQRELGSLRRDVQVRIAAKIGDLASEPRPQGVKKLEGTKDVYRVRVGDYPVVYRIDDGAQTVTVTAIGDRKEIYRRGLG
jgi:mRNA interferase RelE/StbE